MRKQNNLESVECVGVGSPNPLGEKTSPLRKQTPTIRYVSASVGVGFPNPLGKRVLNYETPHINTDSL